LPDINVWIALASDRHVHHEEAKKWFAEIEPGGAAFCRVTQMGCLRLITNRHVMGADVVTQKEAWQVYQNLSKDQRVTFLHEPSGIEDGWRRLTPRRDSGNKYLDRRIPLCFCLDSQFTNCFIRQRNTWTGATILHA